MKISIKVPLIQLRSLANIWRFKLRGPFFAMESGLRNDYLTPSCRRIGFRKGLQIPSFAIDLYLKPCSADVQDDSGTHQELRVLCDLYSPGPGSAGPPPSRSWPGSAAPPDPPVPEFRFQSCTTAPVIVSAQGWGEIQAPLGTASWNGMCLELPDRRLLGLKDPRSGEDVANQLVLFGGSRPRVPTPEHRWPSISPELVPTLAQTPGQFRLVFPHQYAQPVSQSFSSRTTDGRSSNSWGTGNRKLLRIHVDERQFGQNRNRVHRGSSGRRQPISGSAARG